MWFTDVVWPVFMESGRGAGYEHVSDNTNFTNINPQILNKGHGDIWWPYWIHHMVAILSYHWLLPVTNHLVHNKEFEF